MEEKAGWQKEKRQWCRERRGGEERKNRAGKENSENEVREAVRVREREREKGLAKGEKEAGQQKERRAGDIERKGGTEIQGK